MAYPMAITISPIMPPSMGNGGGGGGGPPPANNNVLVLNIKVVNKITLRYLLAIQFSSFRFL